MAGRALLSLRTTVLLQLLQYDATQGLSMDARDLGYSIVYQYVDGHGKYIELLKLIGKHGKDRARAFRLSILEIADVHASRDEIVERESHWKRVLLSRSHGYNAN